MEPLGDVGFTRRLHSVCVCVDSSSACEVA